VIFLTDTNNHKQDQNKGTEKDQIRPVELDIAKLNDMTRTQLYALARNFEIANYSKMSDHELIFSILRKQTE